jgi:hypothetical protein
MKTSLAHLPDDKRAQITAIAALIQAEVNAEGKAEALLAILEARGLDVSVEVRAVIEGCKDVEVLGRWIARAMTAGTAEAVVAPAPLDSRES